MIFINKSIAVTDSFGRLYHSTYFRRAKQLVKQGKAKFLSEGQICLLKPPAYSALESNGLNYLEQIEPENLLSFQSFDILQNKKSEQVDDLTQSLWKEAVRNISQDMKKSFAITEKEWENQIKTQEREKKGNYMNNKENGNYTEGCNEINKLESSMDAAINSLETLNNTEKIEDFDSLQTDNSFEQNEPEKEELKQMKEQILKQTKQITEEKGYLYHSLSTIEKLSSISSEIIVLAIKAIQDIVQKKEETNQKVLDFFSTVQSEWDQFTVEQILLTKQILKQTEQIIEHTDHLNQSFSTLEKISPNGEESAITAIASIQTIAVEREETNQKTIGLFQVELSI